MDSGVKVPGGFLALLGRPPRESACECERSNAMQLGPVLSLLTGPVLNDAIKDPANRIAKIVMAEKDDAKVVEELYLAILNRKPTAKEIKIGIEALQGNDEEFARLTAERKKRADAVAEYEKQLPQMVARFEATATRTPTWAPLDAATMKSQGGAIFTKQKDLSILLSDANPVQDTYTITFDTRIAGITGIRLEVMPDKSLPAKGPGRAPNGNFVLQDFSVEYVKQNSKDKPTPVKLLRPQATFSQATFPIANAVDSNPTTGWAVSPQFGKAQTAVFELQNKIGTTEGTTITVKMLQNYGGQHTIGKFRISVTTTRPPILLKGTVPDNIARIVEIPEVQRTAAQQAELVNHVRSLDQELSRLQRVLNEYPVPPSPRDAGGTGFDLGASEQPGVSVQSLNRGLLCPGVRQSFVSCFRQSARRFTPAKTLARRGPSSMTKAPSPRPTSAGKAKAIASPPMHTDAFACRIPLNRSASSPAKPAIA